MKIFEMKPENSKEISDFMESVKVVENGIVVCSNGHVGILYKERSEVGMVREERVTAISGELAKSQKQFVIQDGLARAYTAVIAKLKEKIEVETKLAADIENQLHLLNADFAKDETVVKMGELEAKMKDAETRHKATAKALREPILQEIYSLKEQISLIQSDFDKLKADKETKEKAFGETMAKHKINAANMQGQIKEETASLEEAERNRENAEIFITTTKQYLKDLEEDKVEGVK